jgi:hypothetical protein
VFLIFPGKTFDGGGVGRKRGGGIAKKGFNLLSQMYFSYQSEYYYLPTAQTIM